MEKNKLWGRVWLSTTLVVASLLAVSLLALGQKVLTVQAKIEADPHSQLYAVPPGAFQQPEQKTVYFTFDDGPSKNTEVLLDMLLEEGIKATFFVSAQEENVEYARMLLCRMRDEGHTIALHTYKHRYEDVYRSLGDYLEDLAQIDAFIYESTGIHPNILRFPGGSRTANADRELMRRIADEVTRRGYIFYDWTVVSGDDGAKALPAEQIAENILSGIQGRQVEIVLCHDNPTPTTTPEAVRLTLDSLREQGYAFDRLVNTVPPVQLIN